MFENKTYILLLLFLLLLSTIKKIYGKEEPNKFYYGDSNFTLKYLTKEYKVEIIKNNSTKCPFYSSGPREIYRINNSDDSPSTNENSVMTICDVSFACHRDKCIYYKSPFTTFFINNNTQHSIRFIKENDNNKSLIIHSCLKKDEFCNSSPNDVKCTSNSQCFSNLCDGGRCVINGDYPLKLCRVAYGGDEDFSIGCGLDINESCSDHQDCDTEYCSSYARICFNSKLTYRFSPMHQYLFISVGFLVLMMFTIILYLYYISDKAESMSGDDRSSIYY